MKSALSQGLSSGLPSIWQKRLIAALARFFSGYPDVRLYASRDRSLEAAGRCLGGGTPVPHDPAFGAGPAPGASVAYWRPFLPTPAGATVLIPLLPVTIGEAPAPACFSGDVPSSVPLSDTIPGFICAGALRGFSALAGSRDEACPLSNPAVEKALDSAQGWLRAGPYVRAVFPEAAYAGVHAEFLRAGVLLNPGYPGPSVLPGDCSPGEARLLADLFTRLPGG
jgi:hypothetical protein